LRHDPYGGAIFLFRGRRGDMVKCLFWDRQGMCLYMKKLDGRVRQRGGNLV
jgi:transposase